MAPHGGPGSVRAEYEGSARATPRKVAVARRRNGSDGVALGTVAAARDGYQRQGCYRVRRRVAMVLAK